MTACDEIREDAGEGAARAARRQVFDNRAEIRPAKESRGCSCPVTIVELEQNET
jgi:hypothetical protein